MSSENQKKLDSLTPAELGKLFPIIITSHDPNWKLVFEDEKKKLAEILGDYAIRIEHFGSTAIPNIDAKPSIDILIEIPKEEQTQLKIKEIMTAAGYHFIQRKGPPPYPMFVKGYTEQGFVGQVLHIHMGDKDHNELWDRLFFRDYLIANPAVAQAYMELKKELADAYRYDRDAYTDGKQEFVKRITELAKSNEKN